MHIWEALQDLVTVLCIVSLSTKALLDCDSRLIFDPLLIYEVTHEMSITIVRSLNLTKITASSKQLPATSEFGVSWKMTLGTLEKVTQMFNLQKLHM